MKKIITFTMLVGSLYAYDKPTLLILWSDSCAHCENFIRNTLPDSRVKDAMKNYKLLNINVNKQKDVPFDIDYTGVVPSFHIVNDKRSQLVNTITGDIPPEEFANFLNTFTKMYVKYQQSASIQK